MVASYTDIKRREIPEKICILIALLGLLKLSFMNLLGVFVALPFLIAAILKENSIGGGDIKLTAAVGVVLGFRRGMYGLMTGLTLLVLFYIILVIIEKIRRKQVAKNLSMPLAPFLGIGFMIIYFIT